MKTKAFFIVFFTFLFCSLKADVFLQPPKGWECISDPEQLPQKILRIYVGPGKNAFTPSINISSEETTAEMEAYIDQAKAYHESQPRVRCSKMGTLQTKAGSVSLLQIDSATQWGDVRFIQAFLMKDHVAYVVTATCLKDEFALFSPQFFKAIQSFSFR